MPSHDIHRLLSMKYLSVPGYVVTEVDRLIDLGPVHDIGRRRPGKPPAYLEIVEQGDVEKLYQVRLREKAARVLTGICEDEVKAKVFFFHHALDILAQRLSSAIVLGLELRKACRDLVEGVLCDLSEVEVNLRKMGIACPGNAVKRVKGALLPSCTDAVLISWVKDNVVPRYRDYKSLSYIRERYISIIPSVIKSDAKYEVNLLLGFIAYLAKSSKTSPSAGHVREVELEIGGTRFKALIDGDKLISVKRDSIIEEYRKELNRRAETLKLSPYGLGRLRKIIVNLASLYSDLYHLPFIEPYCISLAVERILSTRKKRYSLASNVLRCYSRYSSEISEARSCAAREIDRVLGHYAGVITRQRLEEIGNKFIEALEELLEFSASLGIDVLSDMYN